MVALVRAAVESTGSDGGWLLIPDGDALRVAVLAGDPAPGAVAGRRRPVAGAAGLVSSTGQPVALLPQPTDLANVGAAGLPGPPGALVAVPCEGDGVVGVLEVGRAEPRNYTFDDLELVSLLGEIAGALLRDQLPSPPPEPLDLGNELTHLAASDPARYRDVIRALEWMLR
jgi:GAF domain-containing protein